ncbi:MAG: hypothetical protein HC828_13395, partial [Blastochloris sp.]|nr:hypothetical protein [Blastochloris sp.]
MHRPVGRCWRGVARPRSGCPDALRRVSRSGRRGQAGYGIRQTRPAAGPPVRAGWCWWRCPPQRLSVLLLRDKNTSRGSSSRPAACRRWPISTNTRRARPKTRVTIVDGPYDEMLGGLRRGEIDFIIGALRDPQPIKDVIQEPLFMDHLTMLARPGHALAGEVDIPLEVLVLDREPKSGEDVPSIRAGTFDDTEDYLKMVQYVRYGTHLYYDPDDTFNWSFFYGKCTTDIWAT